LKKFAILGSLGIILLIIVLIGSISFYKSKGNGSSITRGGGTIFEGWLSYLNSKQLEADMIILSYGQNDQGYMTTEEYGYLYEKLIRELKKANPLAEIMVVTESSIRSGNFPKELQKVSDYYGVLNAQTGNAFEKSGIEYDKLTDDKVHPNADGYKLYAEEMLKVFEERFNKSGKVTSLPKKYLYENDGYDNLKTVKQPENNQGFKEVDNYLESTKKDDTLTFQTNGKLLGINIIRDKDGGLIDVYVDGELIKQINSWSPTRVKKDTFITSQLNEGKHEVKLVNSGEEGKDYEGNNSEGTYTRIINVVYSTKEK